MKSLDVNPGLRAGRSTQEVLKSLRQEAIANAEAGQPDAALSIPEAAASPAVSAMSVALKSISFFGTKGSGVRLGLAGYCKPDCRPSGSA